ncbi:hypothetical protein [Streptomyces hypolithicus]
MTDTKSPRADTEGTWALPLLTLAPLAVIRLLTELSTPWLVISWILCAVSAVMVAAGWATVFGHGARASGALSGVWGMCILAHAVLVWQLIALVRQ